eukprot:870680-Prymnesium_polylepis.1
MAFCRICYHVYQLLTQRAHIASDPIRNRGKAATASIACSISLDSPVVRNEARTVRRSTVPVGVASAWHRPRSGSIFKQPSAERA